jgi:hypothetical protein
MHFAGRLQLIDRLLDHLEYVFVTIFGRDEIARFIFDGNSKSLEAAEHVRACSEYLSSPLKKLGYGARQTV